MTDLQLAKLEKLIKTVGPTKDVNMSIYIHKLSKERADEIMRGIPRSFRRGKKESGPGIVWRDAVKEDIYGFGRIEITVFYPIRKEEKNEES